MANPSPSYPSAIMTPTDYSALSSSKLGTSTPSHTDAHGKVEEEIEEVQKKLGTGASNASSATAGQVLKKNEDGTTGWGDASTGNATTVYISQAVTNGTVLSIADLTESIISLKMTGASGATIGALPNGSTNGQLLVLSNQTDAGDEIIITGQGGSVSRGFGKIYMWDGSSWLPIAQ